MEVNDTKTIEVINFIKFQKNQLYLNNFLNKGEICFNTIPFFRDIDNLGSEIGDSDECINRIEQCSIDILLNNKILASSKTSQLKITDINNKGNIFSLYTIYTEDVINSINKNKNYYFNKNIDNRMFKLSNDYVIINNVQEFLNRVDNKLIELGYVFEKNFINYYDYKKYNGVLNNFYKEKKYSYQHEYRYFIMNNNDQRIIINIGNINDIAYKVTSKDNVGIGLLKNIK